MDSDQKKNGMEDASSITNNDNHNPKGNDTMYYLYDKNNKKLVYDKTTQSFSSFSLTPIDSTAWQEAIHDNHECTLYLIDGALFGDHLKPLIDTGRISQIEYVYGVQTSSPERFENRTDKKKVLSLERCAKIQISDSLQSEILMKRKEEEDFFSVPYDAVREYFVLAPEQYPSKQNLCFEQKTETMSEHVSIVEYAGNAPDILIEMREDLNGIDHLPIVLEQEIRPKYALKIDLNYWLPEGIQSRWETYFDTVTYGTAPGLAGVEQRLKRFLNMTLPPPPPLLDQIKDYKSTWVIFHKERFKTLLDSSELINSLFGGNNIFEVVFGSENDTETNISSKNDEDGKEKKKNKDKQAILELRRDLDNSVIRIIQQKDNVSSKSLLDLSNQLKTILSASKDKERVLFDLLHRLDFDKIKRTIDIIDVILKTKELLLGDCSSTLEEACPECRELLKFDDLHGTGFFPNVCNVLLKSILSSYSEAYVIKHNATEALNTRAANIRAEERQNTLYEMSHHIKNLVVTVTIHLKKLSKMIPEKDQRFLKSAMRGADKIRKLVYLITSSSRLTVDDFLYDLSSPDGSHQTLGSLFEDALRESIETMFDKETHGKYMMAFYPSQDAFEKAEKDWFETNNLADVIAFMKKRMNMKVEFHIDSFKKIVIGETKQSATYMSVLLGELTLNMLKALAFVPGGDRVFSIMLSRKGKYIRFLFKNSYVSEMGTGTGYGKTIVENITKGWGGGEPSYKIEKEVFEVEIQLPFYK